MKQIHSATKMYLHIHINILKREFSWLDWGYFGEVIPLWQSLTHLHPEECAWSDQRVFSSQLKVFFSYPLLWSSMVYQVVCNCWAHQCFLVYHCLFWHTQSFGYLSDQFIMIFMPHDGLLYQYRHLFGPHDKRHQQQTVNANSTPRIKSRSFARFLVAK